jgi:hypothetical protein
MKTIKANYVRGVEYFWAPRATLACLRISRAQWMLCALESSFMPLYVDLPEGAKKQDYVRVMLTIIRTKAEVAALNRKYAKIRAARRKELQKP